jgi:hypothetical protein
MIGREPACRFVERSNVEKGQEWMNITELRWRDDLERLVCCSWKTVMARPMMFGTLLAMSLIETLWPSSGPIAWLIQCIVSSFLGFYMVQLVWSEHRNSEETIPATKTPWIRLAILEWLYGVVVLILSLLFIIPGVFWGLRASLSFVVMSVENRRVQDSIQRSEQLLKDHLGLAAEYLLPINLIVYLPAELTYGGVQFWCDSVHKQSIISTPLLIGMSSASVLTTAGVWLVWLVSLGYLVRLYAYSANKEIKPI